MIPLQQQRCLNHTRITYDNSAFGLNFHTDINVNGKAQGPVVMEGVISFHWTAVTGSGECNVGATLAGDDAPIGLDIWLKSACASEVELKYTCSGNKLIPQGLQDGPYLWAC